MRLALPLRPLIFFGIGGLLCLLLLEGVLRLLPVHSRIRVQSTDARFPIVRAQPHQDYRYSFGWDFLNPTTGRTNNVGMFNSADYVNGQPTVGVVGDSYIEARMLPYRETLQARLARGLAPNGLRVVAASSGGAGLADYYGFSAMLRREVSLRGLVILVSEGDFMEAFGAPDVGYMGMRCTAGQVSIFGVPFQRAPRSALRSVVGGMALVRYLDYNLKAGIWFQSLFAPAHAGHAAPAVMPDAGCFTDYFAQLQAVSGLASADIVLIVDGLRGKYDARRDASLIRTVVAQRAQFMALAQRAGFHVVDMQPIFDRVKNIERRRVDFNPRDNHWNGFAHRLAAEAALPVLQRQMAARTSPARSAFPPRPDHNRPLALMSR